MRIGIVVTTHHGELRPNGQELINTFVGSCKHINCEYKIYLFDNSSETPIKIEDPNVVLTYVEDQTIRGLTGTWNDGVGMAYHDGCDIILVSNDDVIISDSINIFIDSIIDSDVVYGPLSNGILCGYQKATGPSTGVIELTGNLRNMLNGFLFGFNKDFFQKYKMDNGKLFSEEYPWGGNEEEFQRRIWSQGARSIIIRSCYVHHTKYRGWLKLHNR